MCVCVCVCAGGGGINLKRARARTHTHTHRHARGTKGGRGKTKVRFKTCPSHGKAKLLHPLNVSSFSNNAPELKRQHSRWFQVSVCLHPSVALSSPHKTRDDPAPSLFALKESFPSEEGGGGRGGGGEGIASYINIKLLEETECTTDEDVQQGFRTQAGRLGWVGELLHRISILNYFKKPTARRMKTRSRGSVHRRGQLLIPVYIKVVLTYTSPFTPSRTPWRQFAADWHDPEERAKRPPRLGDDGALGKHIN